MTLQQHVYNSKLCLDYGILSEMCDSVGVSGGDCWKKDTHALWSGRDDCMLHPTH